MSKECCEGNGIPIKKTRKTTSRVVNFAALPKEQQQAFADFQLKEKHRHLDDIESIDKDLAIMEKHYGIIPSGIFVNKWLEVKP